MCVVDFQRREIASPGVEVQMYPSALLPDGLRDVVKRAWRLTSCLIRHVRERPRGFQALAEMIDPQYSAVQIGRLELNATG